MRYVEPETFFIREDLVTFLECDSSITGEALAEMILGFLTNHLDPSKMRGQAYDVATCQARQAELLLGYLLYTLLPCTHIVLPTV